MREDVERVMSIAAGVQGLDAERLARHNPLLYTVLRELRDVEPGQSEAVLVAGLFALAVCHDDLMKRYADALAAAPLSFVVRASKADPLPPGDARG